MKFMHARFKDYSAGPKIIFRLIDGPGIGIYWASHAWYLVWGEWS